MRMRKVFTLVEYLLLQTELKDLWIIAINE